MNKPHLLQKLTPLGIAAFSAITFTAIATRPTQAADFTQTSTLEWEDSGSNIFNEATAAFAAEGLDFTATYSGSNTDGEANVGFSTGDFADFISPFTSDIPIVPLNIATGTWTNIGILDPNGFQARADFQLQDDIEFQFDVNGDNIFGAGDVKMVLPENTIIQGEIEQNNAIEFELESGEWEAMLLDPDGNIIDDISGEATASVFEFGQTPAAPGLTFDAEADFDPPPAPVPEPTTILGLLTISGLGLSLKGKKKLSKAG